MYSEDFQNLVFEFFKIHSKIMPHLYVTFPPGWLHEKLDKALMSFFLETWKC